jgi:hypothetical protein
MHAIRNTSAKRGPALRGSPSRETWVSYKVNSEPGRAALFGFIQAIHTKTLAGKSV